MLFLKDYNLIWGVEKGINVGPTDALSQKDDMDTSDDNQMVTLLLLDDTWLHDVKWLNLLGCKQNS